MARHLHPWLLAAVLVAVGAGPVRAEGLSLGLRPLGGDFESGRTIGPGAWAIEAGGMMPMLDAPTEALSTASQAVFDRTQLLPAWPSLRGLYGLQDGNEVQVQLGQTVGGAWRKFFLRADAPWPGEYLQALIQIGGGFNLASMLPSGYLRVPAIYERGAFTFHVDPGGYYLFNQQPIVDVPIGLEVRPFDGFTLGGMARLRMDAAQLTPTAGSWSFGGGAKYQLGDRWTIQVEANQDGGPPAITTPSPQIEFPGLYARASVTYFNW